MHKIGGAKGVNLTKKGVNLKFSYHYDIHYKFTILQNFNKVHAKIVKQYVCAKSMGFKIYGLPKFLVRPKMGLSYSNNGIMRNSGHVPNTQH